MTLYLVVVPAGPTAAKPRRTGARDLCKTGRKRQGDGAARLPLFPRAALRSGRFRALFLEHALQQLDLLAEIAVVLHHLLDLAHRMQDGRVVASAETPADFG